MNIMKLTLIEGGNPVYIVAEHVASVGVAYSLRQPNIAGVKPISKEVGTLVNLTNGVNHGVTEKPERVVQMMRGHLQ